MSEVAPASSRRLNQQCDFRAAPEGALSSRTRCLRELAVFANSLALPLAVRPQSRSRRPQRSEFAMPENLGQVAELQCCCAK